jgi:hypothetical protein
MGLPSAGRHWPWVSAQGAHPLAGEPLGQTHALASGLADVSVVQEPVDGRCREGLGHQLVDLGRMQVRADRNGSFLIGASAVARQSVARATPCWSERPSIARGPLTFRCRRLSGD